MLGAVDKHAATGEDIAQVQAASGLANKCTSKKCHERLWGWGEARVDFACIDLPTSESARDEKMESGRNRAPYRVFSPFGPLSCIVCGWLHVAWGVHAAASASDRASSLADAVTGELAREPDRSQCAKCCQYTGALPCPYPIRPYCIGRDIDHYHRTAVEEKQFKYHGECGPCIYGTLGEKLQRK